MLDGAMFRACFVHGPPKPPDLDWTLLRGEYEPAMMPCPFCGGAAGLTRVNLGKGSFGPDPYVQAFCTCCGATKGAGGPGYDRAAVEVAVDKWNQRSAV